jgi:hypothetical protein
MGLGRFKNDEYVYDSVMGSGSVGDLRNGAKLALDEKTYEFPGEI